MPSAPGSCLDADTVAAYAAHALSDAEQAAVEAHIDGCTTCRRLLSLVAQNEHTEDTAPSLGPGLVLPKGARVGAYEIDRPLGSGGMGMVYVAHDTRLQRQVALKSVREHRASEHGELVREATAMARLSHPNVVQVFDVLDAYEQTYLAMELVVGSSAREWLDAKPRTQREILDVFLQAGEGVAAAHAQKLIHRDIKPANVLVGDDGRVRVGDFGLAGTLADAPIEIRGTPAFMAPEVAAGKASDERSDLYSFALMVQNALAAAGPVKSSLEKVLKTALEKEPARRQPSMRALLDAIRATQRRPLWVVATVGLVSAGIALSAAFLVGSVRRQLADCARPPPELAQVWNDEVRAQVATAFKATKAGWADDANAKVDAAIQAWVTRFSSVRREACEATWVERHQNEEALASQMRCFNARLREARAVVDELKVADVALVSDPIGATWQTSRLDGCLVETANAPETPAESDVRQQLAVARAKAEAGRNKDSLAAAEKAAPAAKASGNPRLEGEALLRLGIAQTRTSAYADAEQNLKRSLFLADSNSDDAARAHASMSLMQNEFWQGHFEQVLLLGDLTLGAAERAHDQIITSDVLMMMGASMAERERFAEAQTTFERVLRMRLAIYGEKNVKVAAVYSALGNLRSMTGELEEGLRLHRKALEAVRAAVGDPHPVLGRQYLNTGADLMAMNRAAEAVKEFAEAVRISEATQGPGHRDVAFALCSLGGAYAAVGDDEAAVPLLERGEAIWSKVSAKNPKRGECMTALSRVKPLSLEQLELAVSLNPKPATQLALARALTTGKTLPPRAVELTDAARAQWSKSKLPNDQTALKEMDEWLVQHRSGATK